MTLDDIDLFEVNEALAATPMVWPKAIGADPAKLNVDGGTIALGHPLSASGTKLMTTLLHAQGTGQTLWSPDDVRGWRHRQCDDRGGA